VLSGGAPAWQTGMVSWWRFTGNANDYFGRNNGTVNGATLTTSNCKSGQCYSFDGSNDYINIPHSASLNSPNTTGEVTFSAWVNPSSISWKGLMGNGNIRLHIDTQLLLTLYNQTEIFTYSSTALTTGSLQHIAFTYKRTTGNISFYQNGAFAGTNTVLNANLSGYTEDPFTIGQNWGDYFSGTIDEVMIWNRSLNSTEIQQVYNYVYT
jgi:hypothetical protein